MIFKCMQSPLFFKMLFHLILILWNHSHPPPPPPFYSVLKIRWNNRILVIFQTCLLFLRHWVYFKYCRILLCSFETFYLVLKSYFRNDFISRERRCIAPCYYAKLSSVSITETLSTPWFGKWYMHVWAWAEGDYCVSLKMLKLPHKEIYSFILTMLWLSLSSSLSLAKYFYQYASTTVAYRRCHVCHVELILRCALADMVAPKGHSRACILVEIFGQRQWRRKRQP